jgi:hypothetical protein
MKNIILATAALALTIFTARETQSGSLFRNLHDEALNSQIIYSEAHTLLICTQTHPTKIF